MSSNTSLSKAPMSISANRVVGMATTTAITTRAAMDVTVSVVEGNSGTRKKQCMPTKRDKMKKERYV